MALFTVLHFQPCNRTWDKFYKGFPGHPTHLNCVMHQAKNLGNCRANCNVASLLTAYLAISTFFNASPSLIPGFPNIESTFVDEDRTMNIRLLQLPVSIFVLSLNYVWSVTISCSVHDSFNVYRTPFKCLSIVLY